MTNRTVAVVVFASLAVLPHGSEALVCDRGPGAIISATRMADAIFVATATHVESHCRSATDGNFALVLAPGRYLIWVEQDGVQLTNAERREITQNEERREVLVITDSRAAAASQPPPSLLSAFDSGILQETPGASPALRREIERRVALRRSYKPRLTVAANLDFIAKDIASAQQQLEVLIVALVGRADVQDEAARFAKSAPLHYEYEGDANAPLAEASYATDYVRDHPGTVLTPALQLFSLRTYRAAFEVATYSKNADLMSEASRRYIAVWRNLQRSPDSVARFVAQDLDARPFLSVPTKPHPRTFK